MKKVFLCLLAVMPFVGMAQQIPLFVGTYTSKTESKGIYVFEFNEKTGESSLRTVQDSKDPSFLARHGHFLYAVNELEGNQGVVSAYSFKDGELTFLNSLPTGGDAPCYVAVHPKGTLLLTGNYSGGSASVFQIEPNGVLKQRVTLIQNEGKGVNPKRQEKPHVHSTYFSKKGDRVFIQDLGLDQIAEYKVLKTGDTYTLATDAPNVIFTPAGGGPRHIVFDKKEKYMYAVLELTGQLASFKKDGDDWLYQDSYDINEEGFNGVSGAADIKLSPDGNFLYATNRGDANTLAIYAVQKDGVLKKIANQSVLGKGPRNFTLSPDGKFLLVANQYTNNIVVFKRDTKTGLLTSTGKEIKVPAPVCLVF